MRRRVKVDEMVGVVVVTHCRLGEELIAAAKLVIGEELKQFESVSIDPKEGSEEIREKIIQACMGELHQISVFHFWRRRRLR